MRRLVGWGGALPSALSPALIAAGLWWLICLVFASTLTALEERSSDWIWRASASTVRESRIILVDIDEVSLAQLGPWPWSRQRVAELSDKLAAEGASLQVLDIIFPTSSSGDPKLVERLKKTTPYWRKLLRWTLMFTSPLASLQDHSVGPLAQPICRWRKALLPTRQLLVACL